MGKASLHQFGQFALTLALLASSCTSAPSPRPEAESPANTRTFSLSHLNVKSPKPYWSRKINGLIRDFNVSRDGRRILVSVGSDPESGQGPKKPELWLFNQGGKHLWKRTLPSSVRVQTISADGKLIAVSDYESNFTLYNDRGRELWSIQTACRPVILSKLQKVLCYHDEDSDPEIAFDAFDLQGKKTASLPISGDILALEPSEDESRIAIALTGGNLAFIDSSFRPLWERTLEGEIAHVAVASSTAGRVAALLKNRGQKGITASISVLDGKGYPLARTETLPGAKQIAISPDGKQITVYGNGQNGQFLISYQVPAAEGPLTESWAQGINTAAEYSSTVEWASTPSLLVGAGFQAPDEKGEWAPHVHLYSAQGKLLQDLTPRVSETATLYSFGLDASGHFAALATDDGTITAYNLEADRPATPNPPRSRRP